jgi:hypothetical protein
METWTVYGFWAETRERFGEFYRATSARAAEDMAQMTALEKGGTLLVCRVVAGEVPSADRYTAFVDPQDPRNEECDDLEPDVPDVTAGDPEWTVFGIAVPAGGRPVPVERGERYGDVVNAASPLAAEDVARSRLADRDGELLVCAVLAGRVAAVDTYATFADPDVTAASK